MNDELGVMQKKDLTWSIVVCTPGDGLVSPIITEIASGYTFEEVQIAYDEFLEMDESEWRLGESSWKFDELEKLTLEIEKENGIIKYDQGSDKSKEPNQ
jgi:hypothetical protein